MELKISAPRGFPRFDFTDQYQQRCSLQLSSLVEPTCIWLGINNAAVQVLVKGKGWQDVPLPADAMISSRMHLTQAQVRTLLPHLLEFADSGDLTPF
jgi:outer membrane biogenesis lipoprotein LolB